MSVVQTSQPQARRISYIQSISEYIFHPFSCICRCFTLLIARLCSVMI